MNGSDKYVMLISSLPFHGPLFAAKRPPLSRIKLDQRLGALEEEDAVLLQRIEDLVQWRNIPMGFTDAELCARARALLDGLDDGAVKDTIVWRLEQRTMVAALRRRQQGLPAPSKHDAWGFGRWVNHIAANWNELTFRLEQVYPWLSEAVKLLQQNDTVALERLLLGVAWEQLGRLGAGHDFDFQAVVIYLLRWNIIDRWTRYNSDVAEKRFAGLVDAGLGDYGSLSFSEV